MKKLQAIAIAIFGVAFIYAYAMIASNSATGPIIQEAGGYLVRDITKIGTSIASPTALNVGSSSSVTFSTKNAKKASANVYMKATSTASILRWTYYYSQDGTNFYAEDEDTETSQILITHGATDVVHTWTPATTTAVYKRIEIPDVNANFMKITFTGAASTSQIYVEAITEQESN